jgi:DNA-binding CsgD family transcriptional regulator
LPFFAVKGVFASLLARHPAVAVKWPLPPAGVPVNEVMPSRRPVAADLPDPFTGREHAALRFLATGLSTAEIADEMCLSVNTVKTHLAAIYRKLAAGRRKEAVLGAPRYEIRIAGQIDSTAAEAFAGLTVLASGDVTVVRGEFDQASLHGLLERIRSLDLDLVEVRRVRGSPGDRAD